MKTPRKISKRWLDLFRLLPGYDPVARAAPGEWFDADAAEKACRFFPTCLQHIEGEKAGEPFVLEPWQQTVIGCLFGWKRANGMRRYQEAMLGIGRGNGKALALDTKLPTPAGWTTMGDVCVGDVLFNEHGLPCSVLEVHPVRHGHKCYRVGFSDGAGIVADADHLWTVKDRQSDKPFHVKTTETIALDFNIGKRAWIEAKYSIPVAAPLNANPADLPIDPYVLGVWLGDGDSDAARITFSSSDSEIVDHLASCGVAIGKTRQDSRSSALRASLQLVDDGRCARGHTEPRNKKGRCLACDRMVEHANRHGLPVPPRTKPTLQERLRAIGVLDNKHIPKEYLRAGYLQRLALLQGLMDTGGSISQPQGQSEYCTVSTQLRDGVLELVRTLGLKPTCATSRARVNGKDCGERYRITFTAFVEVPVFRLTRKLERQPRRPLTKSQTTSRQIVAVDPVESVPVRCIRVDSPSHLFLASESMIPTHNTPLGAGICLYMLMCDGEPGAQIYGAAADVPQAGLLYRHAVGMVRREPELEGRCEIHDSYKSITLKSDPGTVYRVVSSDAGGKHGYAPHLVITDELHAWEGRALMEAFESAFAKKGRRQPLLLHITTRDFDRPSVCNEKWLYAEQVRDGIIKDSAFLPALYALEDEDDWTDEKNWVKANPNIDVSVDREKLRRFVEKAKADPSSENTVRRLHFNQRTEQDMRVVPMQAWDACADTFTLGDMAGMACFGGLDLASTEDLASFSLVFPEVDQVKVLSWSWCPEERVKVRKQKRVPYETWARQDWLTATTGNQVDYNVIEQFICDCRDVYGFNIAEISFDGWNAAQITSNLAEKHGFQMVKTPQSLIQLSAPTKEFLRRIKAGTLRHNGNPVLRWAASNMAVHYSGKLQMGADLDDILDKVPIMPSKQASADKIDPVCSVILAIKSLIAHPESYGVASYHGEMVL